MAMEKPVVACNTGSIPEVVRHGETGILVEPKNPAALVEGITTILDNQNLAKTLAANAKKLVESEYTLKNMVGRIEGVYNDLIEKFGA
jgi:glycosyltransferase involved in cell wall biosynthesis